MSNETAQSNLIDQGTRVLLEHSKTPHEMHNGRAKFECCTRDVLALVGPRIREAVAELENGTLGGLAKSAVVLDKLLSEIEARATAEEG